MVDKEYFKIIATSDKQSVIVINFGMLVENEHLSIIEKDLSNLNYLFDCKKREYSRFKEINLIFNN